MKLEPRVFCIIFILLFAVSVSAQRATTLPTPLNKDFTKVKQDYAEAVKVIEENHFSGARLDHNGLTTASMNYLLQGLDPHSIYLDAQAATEFKARMDAQYVGIGSVLKEVRDARGNIVDTFIRFPFKDGPAFRAGVRFGDKVVEINGVSLTGKGVDDVRSHLICQRGTKVALTVERNGTQLKFDIIRDAIPTPSRSIGAV